MKRDSSSRLGEQQAEGNLGNERNRHSSDTGRGSESPRNRDRSKPSPSSREGGSNSGENWSQVADADDLIDSTDRSQR
jgi:hypothetical protein